MRGRIDVRCSSVPYRSRFGPDCRSAIQCAATGAPAASSSSVTAYRSIAVRSWPPYFSGQVMPSQPRSPSFLENAGSTPDSQVSTCVVNEPAASSVARNSRTSSRTCSAAADRGAGASVNEVLLIPRTVPEGPGVGPLRSRPGVVLVGRPAGELAQVADDVAGRGGQREQRAGHEAPHAAGVEAEHRAQAGRDVEPGQRDGAGPRRLGGQVRRPPHRVAGDRVVAGRAVESLSYRVVPRVHGASTGAELRCTPPSSLRGPRATPLRTGRAQP